jgi:hypothetical protein
VRARETRMIDGELVLRSKTQLRSLLVIVVVLVATLAAFPPAMGTGAWLADAWLALIAWGIVGGICMLYASCTSWTPSITVGPAGIAFAGSRYAWDDIGRFDVGNSFDPVDVYMVLRPAAARRAMLLPQIDGYPAVELVHLLNDMQRHFAPRKSGDTTPRHRWLVGSLDSPPFRRIGPAASFLVWAGRPRQLT